MILRDLKLFWVIIRRGHLRSFQGERGDFRNTLCEILNSLESRGDGGNHENFIKMKFLVVSLLPIKISLT